MGPKGVRFVRRAVLFAIFIVVLIVANQKYREEHSPHITRRIAPPDASWPTQLRGTIVYLKANHSYSYKGFVARELFRQAVLVAARDELGLQTRDGALREWKGEPPGKDTLAMDFDIGVHLHDAQTPPYPRWHRSYDENTWPTDLASLSETTEKLSREDFASALRNAGWTGSANVVNKGAPAPEEAEAQLREMEELSQFAALRETHAAIRRDGESAERLGVLVRGYANLGQLTRYHWSTEYAVFTARSLLYAQRMVNGDPTSAFALWHRAYARAMAGLQGSALVDLDAADKLTKANPPAWVTLLAPFCKSQTGTLVNLSTANSDLGTLGTYLAFLSVEQSGSQGAIMGFAQGAFARNQKCLRILETMLEQTGPGMISQLSEDGSEIISQMMGSELQALPGFPKQLSDQIVKFRRVGGNPQGREIICEQLIDAGAAEKDANELSWAALGRLIQETTFAQVACEANLTAIKFGSDASDYVAQVQPLVADHPFKFVIDLYGLWKTRSGEMWRDKFREGRSVSMGATIRQMPLYWLEESIQGDRSREDLWGWITNNSDFTSFDIEYLQNVYPGYDKTPWGSEELKHLPQVSPQSPVLAAAEIRDHWDPAKAENWELEHGDHPTVAYALGLKYSSLRQWKDAEKWLRKYVAVSPDQQGYEALATVFKKQNMGDKWVTTLKEYLAHGEDFGLQFAAVQVEIADYFMDLQDYKSALPYAQAADDSGAEWAMQSLSEVYAGLGDWKKAEQHIIDAMNSYEASPFAWYAWCAHTGHGNLQGSEKAMFDYCTGKGDGMTTEDLLQMGCIQMMLGKNADALATFKRRLQLLPGPISALHIALIDDELHDWGARDAQLDAIEEMPEHDSTLGKFAVVLRTAGKAGPKAIPDPDDVEEILEFASDAEREQTCALLSRYLEDRGQISAGTKYLKRCIGFRGYAPDRLLVDSMLRKRGLDPWQLEQLTSHDQQ